jgi:hypothetical protein
MAAETAQESSSSADKLIDVLSEAYTKVREGTFWSVALDPSPVASAFMTVNSAYTRASRTVRARLAAWRSRAGRGLWSDGFGRDASKLYSSILNTFDSDTIGAAGLHLVSSYRSDYRKQLQRLLSTGIREIFAAQVENLETVTVKRLRALLLKTLNDDAESIIDSNGAALRQSTFAFEAKLADFEVPALGLTKDKVVREMATKLNDEIMSFSDSPIAKIKRSKQVSKVVNKERKPSQRSFDVGLDLVAVLRPDGFGSLQGFAAYQLGGNSVTFGIHNDADDPQTIAQFGGVRPPLLRVQPKLRLDVEL